MELGIIANPQEKSFKYAAEKGLDFLEFCLNEGYDMDSFYRDLSDMKKWIVQYRVNVGSIGRWKTKRLNSDGSIIEQELITCKKLIDAASDLSCESFVCGCNYLEEFSYQENCNFALAFFSELLDYARDKGVGVSTYNCRKVNFVHSEKAWSVIHTQLKELGIKFDPANSLYYGGDYLKEAAVWGDRFFHVHLKGALLIHGQRFDDPPAGLDQIDWNAFMSILYAKNYNRGLSIEPHSQTWVGSLGEWGIEYTMNYFRSRMYNK